MKKVSLLFLNLFVLPFSSFDCHSSEKKETDLPVYINEMGLTQLKLSAKNEQNIVPNAPSNNQESKGFITDNFDYLLGHHKKFTPNFIEGLVQKGKKALNAIYYNQIDSFSHKLEYFSGDLSAYSNRWFKNGFHYGYGLEEISKFNANEKYLKEREEFIQNRNAQLETFICIIWALTDNAFKKKQGFIRGAFTIIDPDKKLSTYIEKFACYAAEAKSMEELPEAIFNVFGSNIAYARNKTSSHYIGYSIYQIGIDARFNTAGLTYGFFPFQMSHLLCGSVSNQSNKEKTFVKFEEEGLGDIRSIVSHFFYYSASTENIDKRPDVRREKAIPQPIAEAGKALILKLAEVHQNQFKEGAVTQPAPDWIFKIIEKYNKYSQKPNFFEESSKVDISRLYALSTAYKASNHQETRKLANQLYSEIINLFDEKTIEYRTGNEVIIALAEFADKNPTM